MESKDELNTGKQKCEKGKKMKQEWRCDKKSEACVDMSADVPPENNIRPRQSPTIRPQPINCMNPN